MKRRRRKAGLCTALALPNPKGKLRSRWQNLSLRIVSAWRPTVRRRTLRRNT